MPSPKTFNELYENELSSLLQPLEFERKKIMKLGYLCYLLGGLTIILFIFSVSQSVQLGALFAFITLIGAIISIVIFINRKKRFVAGFKETIIRPIIKFIEPSFEYSPQMHVSKNDYSNSGLFLQKPDRYSGDDYVEGKIEKTFFCFSELHTEYRQNTGKNASWITIFQGLFFIADFNKNFHGRTFVWSRRNPQLNFFTKLFSSFAWNLEKVELESPEFGKRFIVYSSDQVEARYILTPSFMERLAHLQDMMGSSTAFSFVNTNINVAIPIRDKLFEPRLYSVNDYQSLGDYYNTVHIVLDIVSELELNQRLWNKE